MTWNPKTQKWELDVMSDDALPPDSLVGRMLNPEPELGTDLWEPCGANDGMRFPEESDVSGGWSDVEPQPLWREMLKAGMHAERCDPGTVRHSVAAEIEALRDWLLPVEPEPVMPPFAKWSERQRLRALLTEQARIARGD